MFLRYYILKGNAEGRISCFPFCSPSGSSLLFQVFHLKKVVTCPWGVKQLLWFLLVAVQQSQMAFFIIKGIFAICYIPCLKCGFSFILDVQWDKARLLCPVFLPSGETKPSESRGFLRSCCHALISGCSWGRSIFWLSVFWDSICTFPFRGAAEGWIDGFFWPWVPLKITMLVLFLDLCCFVHVVSCFLVEFCFLP